MVCVLSDDMSGDLGEIIKREDKGVREKHLEGSFLRLFWEEALSKHPNGMRWHPLMIRSGFKTNHRVPTKHL